MVQQCVINRLCAAVSTPGSRRTRDTHKKLIWYARARVCVCRVNSLSTLLLLRGHYNKIENLCHASSQKSIIYECVCAKTVGVKICRWTRCSVFLQLLRRCRCFCSGRLRYIVYNIHMPIVETSASSSYTCRHNYI